MKITITAYDNRHKQKADNLPKQLTLTTITEKLVGKRPTAKSRLMPKVKCLKAINIMFIVTTKTVFD